MGTDPGAYSLAEVDAIEEAVWPLLEWHNAQIQGAVIACLLARWLATHPEHQRARVLATEMAYVQRLVGTYTTKPPP